MRFLEEKFYQQDIPTLAVYGSFLNKFHIVLGVHHIKACLWIDIKKGLYSGDFYVKNVLHNGDFYEIQVSVSLTALRSVEDAPPRQKVFDKPCEFGFRVFNCAPLR